MSMEVMLGEGKTGKTGTVAVGGEVTVGGSGVTVGVGTGAGRPQAMTASTRINPAEMILRLRMKGSFER